MERPLWRWAVFCCALRIHRATGWTWAIDLAAKMPLPAWFGITDDLREFPTNKDGTR